MSQETCPPAELPRDCAAMVEILRALAGPISAADLYPVIQRDYPEIASTLSLQVESVRWRLQLLWFVGWVRKHRCAESGAEVYAIEPSVASTPIPCHPQGRP